MKCPACNTENNSSANFCVKCGNKLYTACNCWVKKKPYNCGQKTCPGYQLFITGKHNTNNAIDE